MLYRVILFFLFLAAIMKGWYWLRDGFDCRRIGICEKTSQHEIPDSILPILDQPFSYLGRGRQAFVFQSRDGQYVLKLPRMDRYQTKLWVKNLTQQAAKSDAHKQMRKTFCLRSFKIAYEELREETALLYIHLETTPSPLFVSLHDRLGLSYRIPLHQTHFLLQKKLPLAFPLFQRNLSTAKKILTSFLKLARLKAEKHIFNRDSHFLGNFAYDGEKVIQIDVGSFHYKPDSIQTPFQEAVSQMRPFVPPSLLSWYETQACL